MFRIPKDALKELDRLEELEVGLNYIKEIAYDDMLSLKNLKHFSMFGCHRGIDLDIHSNAFQASNIKQIFVLNCNNFIFLGQLETNFRQHYSMYRI